MRYVVVSVNGMVIDKDFYTISKIKELENCGFNVKTA
jgi:hypothetical protein